MDIELDFDVSRIPWPNGEKKLFVSSANGPNALFIHPSSRNWDSYAHGYQSAYERLFETWESHWPKTDSVIYPLAFLCRQFLELRLKGLIQQSQKLLMLPDDWPQVHKLDTLWSALRPLIAKIWPEGPDQTLDHVEKLILEFASFDEFSMTFRYPVDRSGKLHMPDIESLDISALEAAMEQLSGFFDGVSGGVTEYLSYMQNSW